MEEQILPVGIESEVEHVQSEIDRVDAIFAVATGPMGYQEINYHIIDEERNHHINQQSFPPTSSMTESPSQDRHTVEFFDSAINKFPEDHVSIPRMQNKTLDNDDDDKKRARFSLPEIDGSIQQETRHTTKKVNNSFKHIRKEQQTSSPITQIDEEEQKSPFLFLNPSTMDIPERCLPPVNSFLQQQAEALLPFYTFNELARHNDSTDAWICIFGHIYDVTSLIKETQGTKLYQQLISYAGQDISSWFDEITFEPRRRIDPHTHASVSLIEHLPTFEPLGRPFWQRKDLSIGRLTEHPRYIRLIHNFSPHHPYIIEVAEEETIGQIAMKFLKYNSHIFSYAWRYNGQILDYNKTLTENGLPNEEDLHDRYGWRSDNENCPTILLYFCDDLTIA